MPVPEGVLVQHVVKVYPGDIAPGVHCTSIWTQEHATALDVIETVLEKLTISADPQMFDLIEVYNDIGEFFETPDTRGRTRTIQEFESPVKVQREWQFKQGIDGTVGEYRIYLRQKTENIVSDKMPNVRMTWLDGLTPNSCVDEWNFDPLARKADEIDDLVDLPVLNEAILLEKLQSRFERGRIYTYVGGILIAVNPFKYFPIYNPKYVLSYQHKNLGELPPHIFAIADIAYHRMLKDRRNQCIVISGESGSGKTESTKLVLHHLTALSHKTQASILERTILAAGPVLEAFGNAKTCHNNNSSRFGKFTEITYGADGVVCGAVLRKYLLEKSRIVAQGDSERNYHVFYYLLVGSNPSERQSLNLLRPEDYAYLNKSQCYTIDRVDESYEFLRLQDSMRSIGFCGEVQQRLFTVLSAVLHIGNVHFVPKERSEDAVSIKDNGVVDIVSDLLKVDKQVLVNAFTVRRTVTRGEVLIRPYKVAEAIATRDGMAKALYGSIFDWIVLQINQTLKSRHNPRMSDVKAYSIGVLDIFGFEDFEMNSFEQFCINFANENLQFYLNQHIFKIRQDEYFLEGLQWDKVDFIDNESCLNLISGRPLGLINLLDEECSLSVGTDESLLAKFNQHHALNHYYEKPPTKEPCFSIVHYAGVVKYTIKDFKAKNQDLMRKDIVSSLKNSKMLFLRKLLGSDPFAIYKWSILRHLITAVTLFKKAAEARRNGKHFFPTHKNASWTVAKSPTERKKIRIPINKDTSREQRDIYRKATKVLNKAEAAKLRREHQKQKYKQIRKGMEQRLSTYDVLETFVGITRTRSMKCPTVIGQFQNSLTELMDTLNKSHPFFVRCLRSNKNKAPMEFNAEVVLRQLQYTGMLETVKVRQAGYPCRIQLNDFVKQYRNLLPKGDLTSNDEVPLCLKSLGLDPNHYQVGKNKVFMRESQYRILREKLQSKLDATARIMQQWIRAKLERKRFLLMRKAAITIQSSWRAYIVRKKVEALQRKLAVRKIEEAWLVYTEKRKMESIQLIQANWRGFIARRRFKSLEMERHRLKEENIIASQHDTSYDSAWHSGKASIFSCTCPLMTRRKRKFKVIVDVVSGNSFSSRYIPRSNSFSSRCGSRLNAAGNNALRTGDITRHKGYGATRSCSLRDADNAKRSVMGKDVTRSCSLRDADNAKRSVMGKDVTRSCSLRDADIAKRSVMGKDVTRSCSLRYPITSEQKRHTEDSRKKSFKVWSEVASRRNAFQVKQAEAIVNDLLTPTIFNEETKDGGGEPSISKAIPALHVIEETKGRAGSLPPVPPREDQRKHYYTEIPEPGELLKAKACSTGNLGSHIYDRIEDLVPGYKPRLSGVYDEIPEIPVPSPTKDRSGSTGSTDSNKARRGSPIAERANVNEDRKMTKKNIADKVLRRRSFVKERTSTPKTSLAPATSEGVILVPSGEKQENNKRNSVDLSLPVNENKGSILKIFRTLKRGSASAKARSTLPRHVDNQMSTGGKEWKPTRKFVVDGDHDLKAFNDFLFKRIADMNLQAKGGNDTNAVSVFQKALDQYHSNLLTTYAAVKNRNGKIQLQYEEMSSTFARALEKEVEKAKEKLPTDLGINLFGSIVDEFVKHHAHTPKKKTVKSDKRAKKSDYSIHNGHKYMMANFSIATFCEFCNSFIWDRGFVCQGCKFTCHKKCSVKYSKPCLGKLADEGQAKSIFGAKLSQITADDAPVPKAVEELMQEIEKNGLFIEGIYRKPGLNTSVNSLKNAISSPAYKSVDLSQYRVHVITSVLKLFFRRLSEPLVPQEFYDDFIRSAELQNDSDIQSRVLDVIQRFPKPNKDMISRLIYHLAQVAMHKESNMMSANGLAIVWAPCLMRSGEGIDSMEALAQLPFQTKCLEVLIDKKAANIRRTLSDIEVLQKAKLTSESRLSDIAGVKDDLNDTQLQMLKEQIETMEDERERLTENLPNLERVNSRGDVRIDSDDGITSDDGSTDVDDSLSFEVSVTPSLQSHPFPLQQRRNMPLERKRANELIGSDEAFSADSSFEDLSADLGDITL